MKVQLVILMDGSTGRSDSQCVLFGLLVINSYFSMFSETYLYYFQKKIELAVTHKLFFSGRKPFAPTLQPFSLHANAQIIQSLNQMDVM